MIIYSKLEEYIIQCLQVSKSNIIITDLEKVKFSKSLETNNNYSIDNYNLSIQVKHLINHSNFTDPNSYLLLNNHECIKILENDSINYACQIIFPIYNSASHIQGLLILYRLSGNYIKSSLKAVENFKKFVTESINTNEKEN